MSEIRFNVKLNTPQPTYQYVHSSHVGYIIFMCWKHMNAMLWGEICSFCVWGSVNATSVRLFIYNNTKQALWMWQDCNISNIFSLELWRKICFERMSLLLFSHLLWVACSSFPYKRSKQTLLYVPVTLRSIAPVCFSLLLKLWFVFLHSWERLWSVSSQSRGFPGFPVQKTAASAGGRAQEEGPGPSGSSSQSF